MQSKKMSVVESLTNIAVGYIINFTANMLILPMFVEDFTLGDNLIIGVLYTGIALGRNYCVRRWFTKRECCTV